MTNKDIKNNIKIQAREMFDEKFSEGIESEGMWYGDTRLKDFIDQITE